MKSAKSKEVSKVALYYINYREVSKSKNKKLYYSNYKASTIRKYIDV